MSDLQEQVNVTSRLHEHIRRQTAEAERERIIALLKNMDYSEGKMAHNENPSGVCRICRAIALIKGDDK